MANKTPFFIKFLLAGALVAALVGSFIAITPLRMFGMIPLALSLILAFFILIIQSKKGRGTVWSLIVIGIATFGLTYGIVTQIVDKPEVAKDEKQEEKLKQDAEEGASELDELSDEF